MRNRRIFTALLMASLFLFYLLVPMASASGVASVVVTPNPIVVHTGPSGVASSSSLVPITITANNFTPNGRALIYMFGFYGTPPTTCGMTSQVSSCSMAPAPVTAGNYTARVRYFPSTRGAGPILSVDIHVVVVTP